MSRTRKVIAGEEGTRRLSALLPRAELPQGIRLRLALDVLSQIVAEGKSPFRPRDASSRARLENVLVTTEGSARIGGGAAGDAGAVELVWELLACKEMPEGPAPSLRDVVDEIPTDVEELMSRLLQPDAEPLEPEAFLDALEGASRDYAATREEVHALLDDDTESTHALSGSARAPVEPPKAPKRKGKSDSRASTKPAPRSHMPEDQEAEPATLRLAPLRVLELQNARLRASTAPPPSVGAAPKPRTLVAHYEGQRFVVGTAPFMIGRSKQATDLRIQDSTVTRHHALIEFIDGKHQIIDLGSLNGIEYKGARIDRRTLRDGDVVLICGHEIRFTYE